MLEKMTNNNNKVHAIILAAGKGTRMMSSKPKVLQVLSDKTLLGHVLNQAKTVSQKTHIVHGFGGDLVKKEIDDNSVNWVEQVDQLGTGHAVAQAMPHIDSESISLILYGDVPLISKSTLEELIAAARTTGVALLSVILTDPNGYGRIIRKEDGIQAIVEQKDADASQLGICEVNTGIMAVDTSLLKKYLNNLDSNNAQGELYLTDIIEMAVEDGKLVSSVITNDDFEVAGVNDKVQLAKLERVFQINQATKFMQEGLTIRDPSRLDCRGSLCFGKDSEIDVNVVIEGRVALGDRTLIGANCYIKNSTIGDDVVILPNSVIEGAIINNNASIGPFSRIRPETLVGEYAKIGNFVEVKKSSIGQSTKISHLSYIGDADIDNDVNIGAGVITCNYDGANKHQTKIGKGVFIGSNSQLVAPLSIGENATIGAGTTITEDVASGKLCLSRIEQKIVENWKRPSKNFS